MTCRVQIDQSTRELRQRQPRVRNERHLRFIRTLPCANPRCLKPGPSHAAHIRASCLDRGKRPTGVGEKPSDRWTVPLCEACHLTGQHAENELAWWTRQGRDPFALAEALWSASGDAEAGELIVRDKIGGALPF